MMDCSLSFSCFRVNLLSLLTLYHYLFAHRPSPTGLRVPGTLETGTLSVIHFCSLLYLIWYQNTPEDIILRCNIYMGRQSDVTLIREIWQYIATLHMFSLFHPVSLG